MDPRRPLSFSYHFSFVFSGQWHEKFQDCADLFLKGKTRSGIYTVQPDHDGRFDVFCDMSNSGGGWTVFQKRDEGWYVDCGSNLWHLKRL